GPRTREGGRGRVAGRPAGPGRGRAPGRPVPDAAARRRQRRRGDPVEPGRLRPPGCPGEGGGDRPRGRAPVPGAGQARRGGPARRRLVHPPPRYGWRNLRRVKGSSGVPSSRFQVHGPNFTSEPVTAGLTWNLELLGPGTAGT